MQLNKSLKNSSSLNVMLKPKIKKLEVVFKNPHQVTTTSTTPSSTDPVKISSGLICEGSWQKLTFELDLQERLSASFFFVVLSLFTVQQVSAMYINIHNMCIWEYL